MHDSGGRSRHGSVCEATPRRMVVWTAVVGLAVWMTLTPRSASAAELSGTIRYNGSRATVSAAQPIAIWLGRFGGSEPQLVGVAYVEGNGGPFSFDVPKGVYDFLFYSIDIHNYRDESASVGAPIEIYNNRYILSYPQPFPADSVRVPHTGLDLDFDDTAVLIGIAGTVVYTGSNPHSSECVQALRNPNSGDVEQTYCGGDEGRYELITLTAGEPYSVRAFLDLNDNRTLDSGEPFGVCGDPIQATADQSNVTIEFGDGNGPATCTIPTPPVPTPTPTAPPAPACVGDCNRDGEVTVNELVKGVNISLGTTRPTECPSFDSNGDGTVTVNELIQGVNAALNGCSAG